MSIVFLLTRPHFQTRLFAIGMLAATILCAPACRQPISREQKALRAGLKQAMQEKSYEKATGLARQILKETPRDNGAWERLVSAQLASGDITGANQTLGDWRRTVHRDSPKRLERTGDVAMKESNPASALEWWSKALAAKPKAVRILLKVARADRALHKWSQEDVVLTRALALEDNAANRVLRARCRRQQHRWSDALEDMRRARELAPNDPFVQLNAQLFERLEKFLAPIRELDARIALTPADDQLMTDRALLFLRSEDPELALGDAENASQLAPWAVRPRLIRAIALQDLGRDAEATAIGAITPLRLASLTPDFLETISRLDAQISLEQKNAELRAARAWQLNDIGQPTLALADAQSALEANPDSAGAHTEASYALAKLGHIEEAYAQIKRATELDATFPTAWDYRGELELARRDYQAAVDSLSRGLAIAPTYVALQNREQAYRQLGLAEKADEDRQTLDALTATN